MKYIEKLQILLSPLVKTIGGNMFNIESTLEDMKNNYDCIASGNCEYYSSLEEVLSKNILTEYEAKRLNISWE